MAVQPNSASAAAKGRSRIVMFRVNVGTDGNWISAYPNSRAGFIGSFQLANDTNIDIRGFEFGGSYKIGKITALDFNQICAASPQYVDMITVEDIANFRQRTSPQGWPDRKRATFSTGWIGDGLRIKGVHSTGNSTAMASAVAAVASSKDRSTGLCGWSTARP